jgi:hypothetical protein
MVTATYASTTGSFALYINGVQEASSTGAATSVPSSPVDAEIGAREYPGAQEYISAYMNDARIYDRALSSSDVAQLYLYTGLNYQSFSVYAGNIFKIFKGSAVNIY